MGEEHLERFRRGVELHRASKGEKLRRMPGRLLYTKLLEQYARRLGKSVQITTKTFWDGRMVVVFPEQVSVAIARYGVFEEGLTRMVMDCLKPGMTFFDVGAHFGYFSLLAEWLVGPTGQVHSFEPTPSTFGVLTANLGGKPHVRLNNLALFCEESSLSLSDYGITYAAHNTLGAGKLDSETKAKLKPTPVTVRATSMDRYVAETGAKPDFIKIDAEGAELDILKGMERVLAEARPAVSLEVGDPDGAGTGSRELLEYLAAKGYTPYEFRDGQIVPHRMHERYEYDNVLFKPTA
jgi:FkbM family methyltransferase